jgi:hypothetical protein
MTENFNRQNAIELLLEKRERDMVCGFFYSLIPDLETLNSMDNFQIELLFIQYIEESIETISADSDIFYYGSSSDMSVDSSASEEYSE